MTHLFLLGGFNFCAAQPCQGQGTALSPKPHAAWPGTPVGTCGLTRPVPLLSPRTCDVAFIGNRVSGGCNEVPKRWCWTGGSTHQGASVGLGTQGGGQGVMEAETAEEHPGWPPPPEAGRAAGTDLPRSFQKVPG